MTLLDAKPAVEKTHYRGVAIAAALLLIAVLALGIYAFRLKRHAEQAETHFSEKKTVAPPVAGPQEQVPILVAYDEEGALRRNTISTPMPAERSERARQAVHVLLDFYSNGDSPHPLPAGADVKAVFLVGSDLAVLDMNSAFADGHRSGILVEELTIASIAQTLAANVPGITRVKFLVEGKDRDTLAGHVSLRDYYDVAGLSAFVINGGPANNAPAEPAKKEVQ